MLTVDLECSSQRMVAAARHVYVTAAAAALRVDGWLVATRPVPRLREFAAAVSVETTGRVITLECLRGDGGAWVWRRPGHRWECPAEQLEPLLEYVQQEANREVGSA